MTDDVLLGGRYRLGRRIGRGGMAEVRLAFDVQLEREVAVKQLLPELAGDPLARARFQREAWSAASLHHPGIVAVFDTGEEPDPVTGVPSPYIVMELVEGHTLGALLRRGEKLSPVRAAEVITGLLSALAYSHSAGIVHQDIKPGNVMLTETGQVKLLDFGIARTETDALTSGATPAMVLGTAKYLSPEQARGEVTDVRSDIYSAGCLMYELLVSRPPFLGDSVSQITDQHLGAEPVPPSRLSQQVGPELDAVVLKALAKDPAHRYQSAVEMKAAIGTALRVPASATGLVAAPVTAARVAGPRRALPARSEESRRRPIATPATSRSRRRMALATSALVAVLFPVGGFGLYNLNREANQGQEADAATVLDVPKAQAGTRLGTTSPAAAPSDSTTTSPTPSQRAAAKQRQQGQVSSSPDQVVPVGAARADSAGGDVVTAAQGRSQRVTAVPTTSGAADRSGSSAAPGRPQLSASDPTTSAAPVPAVHPRRHVSTRPAPTPTATRPARPAKTSRPTPTTSPSASPTTSPSKSPTAKPTPSRRATRPSVRPARPSRSSVGVAHRAKAAEHKPRRHKRSRQVTTPVPSTPAAPAPSTTTPEPRRHDQSWKAQKQRKAHKNRSQEARPKAHKNRSQEARPKAEKPDKPTKPGKREKPAKRHRKG